MFPRLVLLCGVLTGCISVSAGTNAKAQTSRVSDSSATAANGMLVDITIERRKDGKVEQMAAAHVFEPGDIVRLRLKSHFDGFLYVLDQGTSGKSSTIFPAAETGSNNQVRSGQEYLVPAVEDGWFEVEGPPGFDVLFFLLSPAAIQPPSASSLSTPVPPSSLKPRCNDNIFKARGECQDDTAGPAAVPPGKPLPPPLAPLAIGASRDLVFVADASGTVGVSKKPEPSQAGPAAPQSAPILYTFRLAHH